jgi:hypothetical protein
MKTRIGKTVINNVDVFVLDFSCLNKKDLLPVVFDAIDALSQIDSKVKFLIDVTDCEVEKSMVNNLKGIGKEIQKHVDKSAIIGLNYYQSVFFGMYLRFTKSKMKRFESLEKALIYLA